MEGRPLDDIALVERAKNGDVNAYETLVQHYQELAFRVAYQVTGDAADAEDAAQEAFVNAYYALGRFRSGAPFKPWLCRIVANEARNRRMSAQRRTVLAQRALVAQAWDVEEISAHYEGFIQEFAGQSPDPGDPVLLAQTRLVHEWRRFPFLDPRLPQGLLPSGWIGARAAALFEALHATWGEGAQHRWAELAGAG